MKKIFLKISFLFLFLSFGISSFATHIMGGEITWECLNNGQYVFTVKIYRDCNGIAFNVNNIAIEAHNYPNTGNITFIPVNFFSVDDITPSCDGSPCATLRRGDPDIQGAIEEYVLRSAPTTLNGVPPAAGWAFTWTSGNRNVAIDNINNAGNFGITLRAIMFPYFGRNANLCFDSSPEFYQKPSTIICAGERFTYNHSAFDSDLDSLSYEWARPLEGNLCGTAPCQIGGIFIQGINPPEIPFDATKRYRFDSPFPDTSLNPLNEAAQLDSETGEITFTSFNEGEYVSVIKVTSYKCGEKVAEVYRELQTVIASGCASNEPPLISPIANNSYRDTIKVGDTVRFRITILDSIRADNPNVDSLFIFASGQQFGTNFTNPDAGCFRPPCATLTSPLPDTGIGRYTTDFYWETTCDHIQNTTPICFATANSYQFVIRAFDDFCPAAGQTIATYTITILADSLVENPEINCANVTTDGDVTINWDRIHDPDKSFSAFLIYVADFRNGPYTLLDSIFDSTLTSYTHIGAGANNNSKHYIVRVRSGCQFGWSILPTDTISTLYINPILNDTCVNFNWTGLDVPLPNNSDTNYLIYREYPIGSGFVLYDSTRGLSFCDTFALCTDTVTYRIQLNNNGGDCPGGSSSNTQGVRFKYPDPIINLTAQPSVTCNGLSDANAVATVITGNGPFTYTWDSGSLTDTVKNIPAGKYIVTVSDIKGCITVDSINITEPEVLAASIGSSTNVSCNGGSDGTAAVTVTGGTAPYSYAWPSGDTTANDSGLTQGTYVVTITDFNNCTDTSSVVITEPDLLTSTISATTAVSCNGGTNGAATVTALGGTTPYTYAWPSATTTATETGLSQGTYVVTVTDANSCTTTSSVVITEPSILTSAIGTSTNVSCNGGADGTATVTAAGGTVPYSYAWPSGDTTATDTGLTQGTYVVTVTDANSCTSTSSVSITEPNLLTSTISATANISCNGSSDGTATVTAAGGTIPYTYAWPSGTPTATETGLSPGTYVVTVTDFNSCTTTSSVTITEPNVLSSAIATSTNVSCNGGSDGTASVTVTGGTAPYSYAWPSGDTTANDSGLTQGTYVVTIIDFNNCTDTSSVVITEPDLLTSTISATTAVSCNGGTNGAATVTASGGTTPYTYAWPSGTPTATETGLSQGTYVVTVTDANSCTTTSSVVITEPDSLKINATNFSVSCFGLSDGELVATPIGGTSPYSFIWSNNVTDSINLGLTVGNYQVTITDSNGCTIDTTLTITQPDVIRLLVSPYDTICIGNSTSIQATATGGNSNLTFNWNNNLPNSSTHQVSPTTQTTYTVNVTDNQGCSTNPGSIIVTVRDLSKDNLQAFSSGNICIGESTDLTATHDGTLGGYGYTWSNNVGNGLGPISVSPTTTTQYIVNAFDECGTIISDSIDVIVESYPIVSLPAIIDEGCEPLTVNFVDSINGATNNLTYLWDLGNGATSSSSNFNYTYTNDGTYSIGLKISSPIGCETSSSNQSQVIVYPKPSPNFSINPGITDLNNATVTFTNTSLNTNNVEWDFYQSFTSIKNDTVIQFRDTGWFPIKLVAYSRFGCKDSIFKNLRINPVYELVIPNAFTPNQGGGNGGFYNKNDLSNDVFYIHTDLVSSYELQIFNRWGELIFLTEDVNQGWDGYYRGKLSPQDVYVYKVSVVFLNGKRETKTGNFTLFR